ncbi:hypothetical protein BS47DRAFT_1354929 [Hydnum rufescens UP504]|uniref:Uncharacterized protein n=1 Tax=Hydnum rufescens UP504 TaxID=1448309 RepID=A0A9P6AF54_9AGAM|nr:hypothetical protein BS47DRAFT_1354929 [Hydnum rufescens UP504]
MPSSTFNTEHCLSHNSALVPRKEMILNGPLRTGIEVEADRTCFHQVRTMRVIHEIIYISSNGSDKAGLNAPSATTFASLHLHPPRWSSSPVPYRTLVDDGKDTHNVYSAGQAVCVGTTIHNMGLSPDILQCSSKEG